MILKERERDEKRGSPDRQSKLHEDVQSSVVQRAFDLLDDNADLHDDIEHINQHEQKPMLRLNQLSNYLTLLW